MNSRPRTASGGGIVFSGASLDAGSTYFNIWGNGPGNYTYFNNYNGPFPYNSFTLDSFTVTEIGPVPLPAALPLFATGLGALGLLGWRRKRKNAAALAAA